MNEGARLVDILHTVRAPAAPPREAVPAPDLRRPRVHRPQHLAALRRLVRRQPGQPQAGARRRCSRPRWPPSPEVPVPWPRGPSRSPRSGDLRLAGHLAEMASLAAPDDPAVHDARAEVFRRRVAAEPSLMAKGVFSWAASESDGQGLRARLIRFFSRRWVLGRQKRRWCGADALRSRTRSCASTRSRPTSSSPRSARPASSWGPPAPTSCWPTTALRNAPGPSAGWPRRSVRCSPSAWPGCPSSTRCSSTPGRSPCPRPPWSHPTCWST